MKTLKKYSNYFEETYKKNDKNKISRKLKKLL